MRRTSPENENIVPRISPTAFTWEKSSRQLELGTGRQTEILKGEWKIVGWALAADVAPRQGAEYVILCEDDDGFQVWCHASNYTIDTYAEKITEDPTKIAKLR